MARNKNSTALFDVIHAAKKPPKASPSASIPTPRWWGKDRKDKTAKTDKVDKTAKKLPQPAPSTASENVGRQQSWLSAAKKNGVSSIAASPVPVSPESTSSAQAEWDPTYPADEQNRPAPTAETAAVDATPVQSIAQPKVRFIDRFKNRVAAPPVQTDDSSATPWEPVGDPAEPVASVVASVASVPAAPSAKQADTEWTDSEFVQAKPEPQKSTPRESRDPAIRIDPAAREFSFRLSYGGLIAIGFILVMALAIAFIAGKHTGMETADTDAQKSSTGTSGMMAGVGSTRTETGTAPKGTAPAGVTHPGVLQIGPGNHNSGNPKPAPSSENTGPVTPAVAELPTLTTREIGLNYVIIQLYDDLDKAQKACDFVNKNSDIHCTVVQGPRDWAPHNWYSVIGLRPFSRQDAGLADYVRKIKSLGVRFSSNVLNQFNDPREYTWRGDSEAPQQ